MASLIAPSLAGALAIVAGCLAGCREVAPRVTAVRIVAAYPAPFDQVRFSLELEARPLIVPPALLPPSAGAPLKSPQDHLVYLDDEASGKTVLCSVEVLGDGRVLAGGAGRATVQRRQIVECRPAFGTADGGRDGAADDGGAYDGANTLSDADGP